MSRQKIERLIRRQHGVVSRQQVIAAGWTIGAVRHHIETGRWRPFIFGVYVDASAVITWMTRAHAAVLAAGTGAVLVGASSGQLRGWMPRAHPITVAIPHRRRARLDADFVHVVRMPIPPGDRLRLNDLPTTTRLRTATDIAHFLPPPLAKPILDRLLVLEIVDLESLTEAIKVSRRKGSAQARELIETASDKAAADSERKALRLFHEAGITGWTPNYPIALHDGRTVKVDLALVKLKIAVEIKGWAHHAAPDRALADDRRITDLQLAGWIVLPFGWYELTNNPERVVAVVLAAIAERQGAVT
jgi:hypothetical protein